MISGFAIGYFGIPGKDGGKVHLVYDGKPVCKSQIHRNSQFCWCANLTNGVAYLECQHCKRKVIQIQKIQERYESELKKLTQTIAH